MVIDGKYSNYYFARVDNNDGWCPLCTFAQLYSNEWMCIICPWVLFTDSNCHAGEGKLNYLDDIASISRLISWEKKLITEIETRTHK